MDERPTRLIRLGGVGKTAVALRVADAVAAGGGQVRWISARDRTSLDSGLRDLAGAV